MDAGSRCRTLNIQPWDIASESAIGSIHHLTEAADNILEP